MAMVVIFGLVCAAAAWVIVSSVDRWRDRARFASIRAAMGQPLAQRGATGLVATLEGHLEGDAPKVTSFHPTGTSFLDELNAYASTYRPAELPLLINLGEGHRAIIEGDVQVLTGTVESEHGAPLSSARAFHAESLTEQETKRKRGQFRQVGPGDLVRIRGAIEPAPDDDALYRAGSNVVRMRPAPGGVVPAVWIASGVPARRRRTRGSRGALWAAACAGLSGAGAALYVMSTSYHLFLPPPAAPTPIAKLGDVPSCRTRVLDFLGQNDAAGAAKEVASCTDSYARAVEAFSRGDFTLASAGFADAVAKDPGTPPSLSTTETHLLAKRPELAAPAALAMVERFYPGPSTAEKRYLECVAGLVRDLTLPKPAPTPRANGTHPKVCSDRGFVKFAHEIDDGRSGGDELEAGYDAVGNPFTAAIAPRSRLFARPIGVERDLVSRFPLAPGPTRPPTADTMVAGDDYGVMGYGAIGFRWWSNAGSIWLELSAHAADLALFYAWAGVPERVAPYWPMLDRVAASREAKPHVHFVEPMTSPGFDWRDVDRRRLNDEDAFIQYVMSVAAAAALLAGDDARFQRYAPHGEVHSSRVLTQLDRTLRGAPWEEPKEDGHWHDRRALFEAMQSGDGTAVAKVLEAQHTTGAEVLPRIVPRLEKNKVSLDFWFDEHFPAPCLTCGASSYLGHLVDRRAVARTLGKHDEAERLKPIIVRFVDALTEPTIAWELDELETFFARPR